jgi:hypothetical protein
MSRDMVIASLADLKDETRRLSNLDKINRFPNDWEFRGWCGLDKTERQMASFVDLGTGKNIAVACPYGRVGDLLWMRETCRFHEATGWWYAADFELSELEDHRWTPSIHMPRRACRLTGDLLELRVERLHAITELAAVQEGVERLVFIEGGPTYYRNYGGKGGAFASARESYISLWDKLNATGKKKMPFSKNPWVWVVRYKRHELDPAQLLNHQTATT